MHKQLVKVRTRFFKGLAQNFKEVGVSDSLRMWVNWKTNATFWYGGAHLFDPEAKLHLFCWFYLFC